MQSVIALQYSSHGVTMPVIRDNQADSNDAALSTLGSQSAALRRQTDSQGVLTQFQSRYPMGCLTSELLQIHQGSYVVRASVQVGGVTLATGMAAAEALEVAEDRARMRALEVMGIHVPPPAPPSPTEVQSSAYELQVHLRHSSEPAPARLNPVHQGTLFTNVGYDSAQFTGQESTARPLLDQSRATSDFIPTEQVFAAEPQGSLLRNAYVEDEYAEVEVEPPYQPPAVTSNSIPQVASKTHQPPAVTVTGSPVSQAATEPSSSRTSRNGKNTTLSPDPAPISPTPKEPIDLSDVIAQTSVEVKRLGWDARQGSSYLQKTYGKSSRQHLTDDELLEFLRYLQAQPSPNESPF